MQKRDVSSNNNQVKEDKLSGEIVVREIFYDCYSDDHCILDRVFGNITNTGSDIYSPEVNYTILDKTSRKVLFSYL